ncbi:MAG TPA: hypothetical protein VGM17_19105 [Rhizomicrobium sp.]
MPTRMMHTPSDLNDQEKSVEIRKRILKLRWIGEEAEAERLCAVLSQTAQDHVVLNASPATD